MIRFGLVLSLVSNKEINLFKLICSKIKSLNLKYEMYAINVIKKIDIQSIKIFTLKKGNFFLILLYLLEFCF